MEENYSIILSFKGARLDVWFATEESNMEEKWIKARKGLNKIGDNCTDADEFFTKAFKHFRSYGFNRIKK